MEKKILKVLPHQKGTSLLEFLSKSLSLSRNKAKRIIDAKKVHVNNKPVWMARHELQPGDTVSTFLDNLKTSSTGMQLLFENDSFIIANKPCGILSNGSKSFEEYVRNKKNNPAIKAVHRIDKNTSGCLLLAKNDTAFESAVHEFKNHRVKKAYIALIYGQLKAGNMRINSPLDGLYAETIITTKQSNRKASLVIAVIKTGRTHQIRRHLASIGHPVLGDYTYGAGHPLAGEIPPVPRQMLHSYSLSFSIKPVCTVIKASAAVPADFLECARALGLHVKTVEMQ